MTQARAGNLGPASEGTRQATARGEVMTTPADVAAACLAWLDKHGL
jgi:hypothetical protein